MFDRTFIVNVLVVFAALAMGALVLTRAAGPVTPVPNDNAIIIHALPAS